MAASMNVAVYINSCKKNNLNTLFWGNASFKDGLDTIVDFNYKIFTRSGTLFIDEFQEGDLVNFSGKFTWEDNSSYHSEGIMFVVDKAMVFPKPSGGIWSLEQLPSSPPFLSFICQVLPTSQNKPHVVIRGETYFVEASYFLYCNQYQQRENQQKEHFFTFTYKISNPRFRSFTIDKWRLGATYAINGFLRQIIKIEQQVVFLIETTAIDFVVQRVTTITTEIKSSRTVSNSDFDEYINSKKMKITNSDPSTSTTSTIISDIPYSSLPPLPSVSSETKLPLSASSEATSFPTSTLTQENEPVENFHNSYQTSFESVKRDKKNTQKNKNKPNTRSKARMNTRASSKSTIKNIALENFSELEETSQGIARSMSGVEELIELEDDNN